MAYTYDIKTSKKDKKSTVCLSATYLMHSVINIFLSTFLVAHIYSLTSDIFDYAMNVGLYQLSTYAVMMVSYYLFSIWVDRSNRIWCYRIANVFSAALVVITIFYGKDLARLVVLAGALNGLSHGAYYASYNVLKQEMVSRNSMGKFSVMIAVLNKIVNVIFPVILGVLIDVSSFSTVAIYVLVLSIALLVVTFFIKSQRPTDSEFKVVDYIKRMNKDEKFKKKMKLIYITFIFYGFTSIISILLNVSVMMQFESNLSLGTITSVCSLVAAGVLLVVSRFTKAGRRVWVFIVSMVLPLIGITVFVSMPNMYTLITYQAFFVIADVINATVLDIYRNKNLKEAGFYQDIAEHQCVVETILQVVRCISFGLLVLLGYVRNYVLLQVGFVIFVVAYCVTPILLMIYEKRYYSHPKEKKEIIVENIEIEK